MKLLGVVVLYYPDEVVWKNILTYLPYLDELVIWNNTPDSNISINSCIDLLGNKNVLLLGENKNVGIGKALNEVVKYALENEYTHLLTMDQDSSFSENMFFEYKKRVVEYKDQACFAYCVGDGGDGAVYSIVTGFITSGTIHPLSAFKEIGLFREDFFIDAVDCEFACRSRKRGYKIVKVNSIKMNHQLGYPLAYRLFGKEKVTPNYPATRTYYLTRNYFLLYRLYSREEYEGYIWFLKIYCFWRPIGILMAETDKMRKMKSFILGVVHGIIGRSGEYVIK